MKGRCKYCNAEIDSANIRCEQCNRAFLDGMDLGERTGLSKARSAFSVLSNLWKQGGE